MACVSGTGLLMQDKGFGGGCSRFPLSLLWQLQIFPITFFCNTRLTSCISWKVLCSNLLCRRTLLEVHLQVSEGLKVVVEEDVLECLESLSVVEVEVVVGLDQLYQSLVLLHLLDEKPLKRSPCSRRRLLGHYRLCLWSFWIIGSKLCMKLWKGSRLGLCLDNWWRWPCWNSMCWKRSCFTHLSFPTITCCLMFEPFSFCLFTTLFH